eukprot:TRINITY_DN55847_c0_g1_i1.p1 TRINITY_DN55847_c0_g1~~TRINITY_DN55847_c0_g1_i1.p1  ORF type:complete len:319 (-),score=81.03 TRINITY_DN55847_c0_g1_i1:2-919(-)
MNVVKEIERVNKKELELGLSGNEAASWHSKYKNSAYVFIGGLAPELTEGDLLVTFSQYGNITDLNLMRDKQTGKSKCFAFLAYEDQRSTILAVDNLNGIKLAERTMRVDHVENYKPESEGKSKYQLFREKEEAAWREKTKKAFKEHWKRLKEERIKQREAAGIKKEKKEEAKAEVKKETDGSGEADPRLPERRPISPTREPVVKWEETDSDYDGDTPPPAKRSRSETPPPADREKAAKQRDNGRTDHREREPEKRPHQSESGRDRGGDRDRNRDRDRDRSRDRKRDRERRRSGSRDRRRSRERRR